MEPNAGPPRPASARGDRHVEGVTFECEQLPFDGRGQVTQGGTRATRKNGGDEAPLPRELLVSECVHTAKEALQSTRGHPVLDAPRQ